MNKYALFLVLLFSSHGAHAACYANQSGASSVIVTASIQPLVVQRDAAQGAVIGTYTVQPTNTTVLVCDASNSKYYYGMLLFTQPSGIPHVYKTNLDGVGFMVSNTAGTGGFYDSPAAAYVYTATGPGPGLGPLTNSNPRLISFIKIGDITPGTISSGTLMHAYGDGDGIDAITTNLVGNTVTQLACSITTPSMVFPIGDVLSSSFGTTTGPVLSGAQNTQNMGLNCLTGANINVTLNGTQNPDIPGDSSILSLTGQGSNSVAKGVGIQLLYNGSPLLLNTRILLKTSSGGQEMLPLTARYYQTKNQVTTGDASTTATLQLTYQ
jgi:type 1 fimbria pilin